MVEKISPIIEKKIFIKIIWFFNSTLKPVSFVEIDLFLVETCKFVIMRLCSKFANTLNVWKILTEHVKMSTKSFYFIILFLDQNIWYKLATWLQTYNIVDKMYVRFYIRLIYFKSKSNIKKVHQQNSFPFLILRLDFFAFFQFTYILMHWVKNWKCSINSTLHFLWRQHAYKYAKVYTYYFFLISMANNNTYW